MDTAQTAPATSSPVINFATKSKAKRQTARRAAKRPDHPDADLIEYCLEYAMQIAAAQVSYKIDPTDSEFATLADNLAQSRANLAMLHLLESPPKTMDGLRAKAALVEIAIDDWAGDLDEIRQNFLISLADDVVRFQRAATAKNEASVTIAEAS